MINELAGVVQNLRAAEEKMFQLQKHLYANNLHNSRSTLQLASAIWETLDLAQRIYSKTMEDDQNVVRAT